MKKNILFVDDEKPILKTFQRSLRGSEFEIFVAEDGHTALEIIARESIDLIISDMRMPNINGHQLLRKVKDMSPTTIRLILSGHADEKDITRAILDGSCKMYILKPWDSHSLHNTIRQLLDIRTALEERNLLAIINRMDGLRSLPRIFNKLTEMINNDADMHQIAEVIGDDPILTSRVLRMANSAFYGISTGSINQAIVYLGLNAVKGIVLSVDLCSLLPELKGIFNKETLCNHASITNRLVNRLHISLLGNKIPHVASSVGLLSSVGLMALIHQMPDKYVQIAAALKDQPNLQFEALEQQIVGVKHSDVGGFLLNWWDMPQPLIEGAMFHHDPFNACVSDRQLVSTVHLASHYALTALNPDVASQVDDRVFELFNITNKDCEQFVKEEIRSHLQQLY